MRGSFLGVVLKRNPLLLGEEENGLVSKIYWQAKIWAILHDPSLKALSPASKLGREGAWKILSCMKDWKSPKKRSDQDGEEENDSNLKKYSGKWLDNIADSDVIASASDRCAVTQLFPNFNKVIYGENGLIVTHLLSGAQQNWKLSKDHLRLSEAGRTKFLEAKEQKDLEAIKDWQEHSQVFWYLWRCYPQLLANEQPRIHILPAETRVPDASLWSHVSMTAALAGGFAGHYKTEEEYPKYRQSKPILSRPHLVTVSFSPVQEVIKASRKMRDFWAGSWLIHYLSAKVCWKIAQKYGADTIIYPCLYQQPLIDHWLREEYEEFQDYIPQPEARRLLTAGFPNTIVMVIPNNGKKSDEIKDNSVHGVVQLAKDTFQDEWLKLGQKVLDSLDSRQWSNIQSQSDFKSWHGWLKYQWQFYSSGLPLGSPANQLKKSPGKETEPDKQEQYQTWVEQQNALANPEEVLFTIPETKFYQAAFNYTSKKSSPEESDASPSHPWSGAYRASTNVGSWWGSLLAQLRYNLATAKHGRNWQIPTVYGPRSTISGIGPVVNPDLESQVKNEQHWATERDTNNFWSKQKGLFDGREELNATEVVKRGLHRVLLEELLGINEEESESTPIFYPDLTSGVAGWLKQSITKDGEDIIHSYNAACQSIMREFPCFIVLGTTPWGIPWIAEHPQDFFNPRLLSSKWLTEEYQKLEPESPEEAIATVEKLKKTISSCFSHQNNPTDWYVIAAGDGDSMGEWLSGSKLLPYEEYIAPSLVNRINDDDNSIPAISQKPLQEFIKTKKRMGPSTHSAFSRSLLDFANQLVPYLTEERYAGRLIYCGGDDILAYTNLWEWDSWLWDIRKCFQGAEDPQGQFDNDGDYWSPKLANGDQSLKELPNRPLFTLGSQATVSFGVIIAHQSVPMAIAIENLWEAEAEAKRHQYLDNNQEKQVKDAVQVRAIFGSGNILKATAKFKVFNHWRELVKLAQQNSSIFKSGLFEQAVEVWNQHPAPEQGIAKWVETFCSRRDVLQVNSTDEKEKEKKMIDQFRRCLADFISESWQQNPDEKIDREIVSWLKLAAFCLRNRDIQFATPPSN